MEPEKVTPIIVVIQSRKGLRLRRQRFSGPDAFIRASQWAMRHVYGSRIAIGYDEQEFPVFRVFKERGVTVHQS
jgi:hypothetical protein